MTNKAATIYDVAKKAGVSPATVSRVLNDPSKVTSDKRTKILAVIKELDFIPKADAVANARSQYHKIGVIAPFFTQPSFMQRLRGISGVLSGQHYELVIYAIDKMEDLESYIELLVSNRRVDGLIALCLKPDQSMIRSLQTAPFPVCFVENEIDGFDSVSVKNLEGGQKAAEYLFSLGYRHPGFIGEQTHLPYAIPATEERLTGFSFYFANQGILIPKNFICTAVFEEKTLDEQIEKFLEQDKLPDCVFCSSDLIATRFMVLAQAHHISVPGSIGILGFDDIDISKYTGLSSVNQNLDESGKTAAELVLSHIKDPDRPARNILLPLNIIERTTTGSRF